MGELSSCLKITFRTYKEEDMDALYELTKAVWGERVPEKEKWIRGWRWMHRDNPAGVSLIYVAEHDGRLVGQYPLIMENLNIGTVVKAAQIVDTATHPRYRRRGIAFELGKRAINEAKKKNVKLLFGFPNRQSYPLHMKSGWLDICGFHVMIKLFNLKKILDTHFIHNRFLLKIFATVGNSLVKRVSRNRLVCRSKPFNINALRVYEISSFDNRFDDFWKIIYNSYPITIVRNREYLNWRYTDVPNADYLIYIAEESNEICGYLVLECKRNKGLMWGHINDIVTLPNREDVIQHLLSKATEYFLYKKIDVALSKMIGDKFLYSSLRRSGFIPRRSKDRFIAYNASANLYENFLKGPTNWFIQQGDLPYVY